MKHRKLWLVLAAALLLACLTGAAHATAVNDPIDFTISIDPTTLTAPGEVTVSMRVANVGGSDMLEPVTLYDPSGKLVTAFGDGGSATLRADQWISAQDAWSVTQEQLDEGKISYTVRYSVAEADGAIAYREKAAVADIAFTGERVKLDVSRVIDPAIVRENGSVTILYECTNNGNVALSNIRVKENSSISSRTQSIASLAPGQTETVKFTATMKKAALTSSATITYKAANDSSTKTLSVDEAEIPLATGELKAALTADKQSVNLGETVKVTLTLSNSGNATFSNLTVTDEKFGEIFTNVEVLPGATVTREREFTLMEPAQFQFAIAGADNTGATVGVQTEALSVAAVDPDRVLLITLNLSSDQMTIHEQPADVRFTLLVTNNSDIDATDVVIQHGAETIYTISTLAAGQTVPVVRDFRITQAGKFQFIAQTKDQLGNDVSFESNVLQIAFAAPTAAPTNVPVITPEPLVTLAPPTQDDLSPFLLTSRSVLYTAAMIAGLVLAVVLVLLLIGVVARLRAKRASATAYDHLDLGTRRDYTAEPAREDEDEDEDFPDDGAVVTREDEPDEIVMPHAKYLDLDAPDAPEAQAAESAGEETAVSGKDEPPAGEAQAAAPLPQADDSSAYRLSRQAPAAQEPAAPQPAAQEPAESEQQPAQDAQNDAPAAEIVPPAPRARRAARSTRSSSNGNGLDA